MKPELPELSSTQTRLHICKSLFLARDYLEMKDFDFVVPDPIDRVSNRKSKQVTNLSVNSNSLNESQKNYFSTNVTSIITNKQSRDTRKNTNLLAFDHSVMAMLSVLNLWRGLPSCESFGDPSSTSIETESLSAPLTSTDKEPLSLHTFADKKHIIPSTGNCCIQST